MSYNNYVRKGDIDMAKKVRIVKNQPPEQDCGIYGGYSDITQYIGQVFEVEDGDVFQIDPTGKEATGVFIRELDIEVYDGEFEFID